VATDEGASERAEIAAVAAEGEAIKERFGPEDWHQLKLLPLLVFNFVFLRLVRERPQAVSADTVRGFTNGLVNRRVVPEPLFVALMNDVDPPEWQGMMTEAIRTDPMPVLEQLDRIGELLTASLSRKERNTFLGAILAYVLVSFQGAEEAFEVAMTAWSDLAKVMDVDLEAATRALRKLSQRFGQF
jgi:hypothetical protein